MQSLELQKLLALATTRFQSKLLWKRLNSQLRSINWDTLKSSSGLVHWLTLKSSPNRMLYPDFKSRYAILAAAEIASSSDNKVSVRALMEKIQFPAEKYQLGHTKVFFRAGALAGLEEVRDNIVLKLVRWLQGQCYGVIKRKVYNTKHDQRE